MRRYWQILCIATPLFSAVEGTVINATTGKPQPDVLVSLVQPGEGGMKPVGAAKSGPGGAFRIDKDPTGMALLQGIHQSVIYTLMLQPGAPMTGLKLQVYESAKDPEAARLGQRMILVQPGPEGVNVTETLLFNNATNTTFSDPASGSVRFFIPAAAGGKVRVTVSGPGGVPVEREAEKTRQANVFKVDYPLKPGETRFDLTYDVPKSTPQKLEGRLIYPLTPTRLVAPRGVTIAGEGVVPLGEEPQTKASIFDVKNPDFTVTIEGEGSLREPGGAPGETEESGPGIQQIPPRLYDRLYWVLGLAVAILGLGFAILYRSGGGDESPGAQAGKQPRA